MKSKSEAPLALQDLIQDIGIPEHIHTDRAKEMTVGNRKKTCNEYGIKMSHTEKASPWQNRTEIEIREIKKHARRMMTITINTRRRGIKDIVLAMTVQMANMVVVVTMTTK